MNGANPKSTASIAGHPIHPMLIPFPVVFLVTAFVADLVFWSTGVEVWATASMWLLSAGVVMALIAAVAGFTDFLGDERIRSISDAWQHMIGNLIAVVLALMNWYLGPRWLACLVSIVPRIPGVMARHSWSHSRSRWTVNDISAPLDAR